MFRWFGTNVNSRGDALAGWQVECVQLADGQTVVPIFADENSTPIVTVSGIANRAVVDAAGNYDFFVPSGTYSLKFYDKAGVFQRTLRYLPMYGADNATASAASAAAAAASEAAADADRIAAQTARTGAETARTDAQEAQEVAETAALRAGVAVGVATHAELVFNTSFKQNGDRSEVYNDSNQHSAVAGEVGLDGQLATVGAALPNEGKYEVVGGVWLRKGNLDSQVAEAFANDAAQFAAYAGGFETPEFASQAAGEAGTTEGQIFRVPLGTTPQTFNWYRRTSAGSEAVSPLATTAVLAASGGAALVGWMQSGVGAILRSILNKLRGRVSVEDFGASTASADNAPAISAAMAAHPGKAIHFESAGDYVIQSSLGEMPEGTRFVGASHRKTRIVRGYTAADYMLVMGESCALENITVDGNSASHTGGGVQVKLGTGRQIGRDLRVINFAGGIPLHFPCTGSSSAQAAGSQSQWTNLEAWRADSSAGLERFGVVHDDPGVASAGHPIHFTNFNSSGFESIDFGACNNWHVVGSNLFTFKTSPRAVGVSIVGGRISQGLGGAVALTLNGNGSMTGVHCFPAIIIPNESGNAWSFTGGYMNSGYTDNNPNSTTMVFDRTLRSYTPVWRAGGVDITLGDGSVLGQWQRMGTEIRFNVRLIVGSTTSIPSGGLTVSLPDKCHASIPSQCTVSGHMSVGGVIYKFEGRINGGELFARLERDTTGPITNAAPVALSAGAVIIVTGTYIR